MAESVKVAVRVRPFNSREKDRNSKCCIEMPNKTMTRIQDPDNPDQPPKEFSFDFSYWSHDGYEVNAEGMCVQTAPNYADQRTVFDDLGQGVLNNAFKGFNCSLFAYGQTGAGKSYSMVGYGPNKGIVPITCDELFKSITENKGKGNIRYEVTFSMLEIYNEQVRDLLTKDNPKGGLQVRQNPKEGSFFVQGLKKVAVGSYIEIEKRTEEGTSNRTVAATQMNATSSRAHTVVTVTFDQISKNDSGQETKKSSTINLVDLAGSERADSTGATGDRLKEGANINKSLSALGNVISALADLSMGKKKVMVPYRDSVLTKLLQNALGGNSKTIMIAALSPADINHDETLGTLRYADRAKKIKNKAVVNENPMDKLVRELREENEKLKKFLESGGVVPMHDVGGGGGSLSAEEKERMRKEMEAEIRANLALNQEAMQSWDEKLANSRSEEVMSDSSSSKCADIPHLVNLNEDPMLSGVVRHFLEGEEITVGRKDADPTPTITLSGLSIQKQHAVLTMKDGEITIKPASPGAKTKVNGMPLPGERVLKHLDRVLFGSNHLYYLVNPSNAEKSEGSPDEVDWNFAQKEMAEATGFHQFGSSLSKEQQLAQEQVLELLPLVGEANAISEELDKHKNFELVLISGAAQGNLTGGTKVMVKMTDLLNGNSWLWDRGKFMNRRYLMQDLYQRFLDGDAALSSIPREEDPFWEPPEDVLVGTANVFLQSLAYALDFDDKLSVTDYKGAEQASLFVNVTPCNQNGKGLDEDYFVDDTQELLGKPYHYKVTVRTADVHNSRFSKGLFVQYKTFDDTEYTKSPIVKDSLSPEFDHSSIFSFPAIREEHLDWFENGCITLMLYAIQEDSLADSRLMKMSTKELRQMDQYKRGDGNAALGKSVSVKSDGNCEVAQLKSEIILLKRHNERLLKKEKRLQALCEEWAKKPAAEQDFGTFHRQVSAAAYHQSGRLRYRVHMLQALLKSQPQTESNGQVKLDEPKKNGASSRACIIM